MRRIEQRDSATHIGIDKIYVRSRATLMFAHNLLPIRRIWIQAGPPCEVALGSRLAQLVRPACSTGTLGGATLKANDQIGFEWHPITGIRCRWNICLRSSWPSPVWTGSTRFLRQMCHWLRLDAREREREQLKSAVFPHPWLAYYRAMTGWACPQERTKLLARSCLAIVGMDGSPTTSLWGSVRATFWSSRGRLSVQN